MKEKKSKTSILIEQILKMLGNKKVYTTEEHAIKYLRKRKRKNNKIYKLPKLYRSFASRRIFINTPFDNMEYFKINGDDKIVIYLHGGAFTNRPLIFHWSFLKDLNMRTNATIIVPLYPLTPKYNYKQTYIALVNFYKMLLREHNSKDIILMGDSAGGTITLGLTHLLKEEKYPLPKKIIALSPSLDITFSHPKIDSFESHDPMLSKVGCTYVCEVWARGADMDNPLVSPKFANYDGFPDTYIFYGTKEILCPELRDFVTASKGKNFNLYVLEKPGMNHVYPLFPIPEAQEAKKLITDIIKN